MSDTTEQDARQALATEPSFTEPANPPATETAPAPGQEQPPPADSTTVKPDPKADPKADPRDRAIRQMAFEQRETRRQLQAARDELERIHPRDPNAPPAPADIERMVQERAQALIEHRETQGRTEAAIAAGNAAYPDFTERCNELASMGAADNPAFMSTIWKIPDGHKVIVELAGNPADAARILKLPPVDLALELAGLAQRISAAPSAAPAPAPAPERATSRAPPPITPLATAARTEVNPETMSEAAFQVWWNKQTRARSRPG
jgi:hypothetical protein